MAIPKRPSNVSPTANYILPDQQEPAGSPDTQQRALIQFLTSVQHENAQANQVNQNMLTDYAANVQQRAAYHLPPPKMRPLQPMHQPIVMWAPANGDTAQLLQQPGDVCWIDEVEVEAA